MYLFAYFYDSIKYLVSTVQEKLFNIKHRNYWLGNKEQLTNKNLVIHDGIKFMHWEYFRCIVDFTCNIHDNNNYLFFLLYFGFGPRLYKMNCLRRFNSSSWIFGSTSVPHLKLKKITTKSLLCKS